ncbi:ATP-binding protein [Archangium lansingense]|uniref:histidine kinase n=1 Tax=Archangium lansingense TaxID=2995310 RepID=A0ABT4A8G2_9BACT|nr:ATP-binding protein [Archangium lansinium]MCY1077939.1 PAS domain S-box protein [Archangium lansinium]
MGHEVVVASGPEVTAATISLVDVLVVGAEQVREKSEWFSRLRAQIRAAEVSVLGMAASLAEEDIIPLMEIGVDDYLVAPFDPVDVRARIALFERRCYAFMRRQSHEESARGEIERLAAIIQTQNDIALAGLDLDVVMRLIAERAMILCGAGGAAVGIIEGEEMFYRVCTGYSKQFEGARLPIANTMAGSSVLRGEVMRTDDTERDPRANVETARRLKVRSMLNVPLKRDNQTVGVLSIASQVPFAFVDSDERTLELMAGLLGAAMGNAAEHAAKQALMTEVASIVTALQESQHLFDSFLNNNPALAYMKDEAGRRVFANEPFRRFFGLSPGLDVSTIPDEQFMPTETVAHLREQDDQAFKSGQPSVSESMIPTPEGEQRQFLTYRFIARNSSGQRFLGGVSFDITERKAAEEALRRSEESFRALIEGSPEAIFVHRGGPLLYVNPSACSFLRLKANELVGRSLLDFVHPEDRSAAGGMLDGMPSRGSSSRVREIRFQPPGGGLLTAEISSLRLVFAGQPATLVSARDLTERKQIQARLVVADRLASVGTLAAGVAHEINNPLAFVISNLSFLTEELHTISSLLPEGQLGELEEVLAETNEGVNRVRLIVQDLKTFSRGDEELPTAVDLRRGIDSALALARGELRHRATVVKEVAEVPLVEGSEARFGQVVLNLLINAAHAIAAGQPDKNEIRVVLRSESNHAIIEVKDTGCGMPREVLDRIFDPFFTTKPVGVGTGLGLSICHGIITGFGGEITASSDLGKGSTFRISLPALRSKLKAG